MGDQKILTGMKNIDELIKKISIFENGNNDDFGLYHGQTGLAVLFFVLYGITGDKFYYSKAHTIVDHIADHISSVQCLDFRNGLAGIGWGIEWFVQNQFVEADTEEVLEDFDDELYKAVVYTKSNCLSLENGTLGNAMYFYKRLLSKNPTVNKFKQICNKECLIFLIDDIKDSFFAFKENFLQKKGDITVKEYGEIAQCLIFLKRVKKLNLNTEIINRLIGEIINFIQESLRPKTPTTDEYKGLNTYLVYALHVNDVFQRKEIGKKSYYKKNLADTNHLPLFIEYKLDNYGYVPVSENTISDFLSEIDPMGRFHWQEAFGF